MTLDIYDMKIEKKPLVPPRKDGGQYMKYPWDKMKIGDSFIIEGYTYKRSSSLSTIGNNWCNRNNNGAKIVIRKEGNNLRVYMVEK